MANKIIPLATAFICCVLANNVMAADFNDGASLYKKQCALCHGATGNNRLPNAANFQRREGMRQSDQQLFNRIRRGKNGCPSFAGLLKDQQILTVISHLRKLGR